MVQFNSSFDGARFQGWRKGSGFGYAVRDIVNDPTVAHEGLCSPKGMRYFAYTPFDDRSYKSKAVTIGERPARRGLPEGSKSEDRMNDSVLHPVPDVSKSRLSFIRDIHMQSKLTPKGLSKFSGVSPAPNVYFPYLCEYERTSKAVLSNGHAYNVHGGNLGEKESRIGAYMESVLAPGPGTYALNESYKSLLDPHKSNAGKSFGKKVEFGSMFSTQKRGQKWPGPGQYELPSFESKYGPLILAGFNNRKAGPASLGSHVSTSEPR